MLTITHSQGARELLVKHAAFAAESAGSQHNMQLPFRDGLVVQDNCYEQLRFEISQPSISQKRFHLWCVKDGF